MLVFLSSFPFVQQIKRTAITTSLHCFYSHCFTTFTHWSDQLSTLCMPKYGRTIFGTLHAASHYIMTHNTHYIDPSWSDYSSRITVVSNNNNHSCLNCSSVPKPNCLSASVHLWGVLLLLLECLDLSWSYCGAGIPCWRSWASLA